MDRNTFTGLFLIMIIIAGSVYFLKPSDAEIQKEKDRIHLDSLKKAGKVPAAAKTVADTIKKPAIDSAALKSPFGASLAGSEQLLTLENKDIKLKVSTRGGRIYSAELKNFKTYDKKPLILFDGTDNKFGTTLTAGSTIVNTNERYFTQVTGNGSNGITLRLSYSPTQYIDYIYTLPVEGYKVDFTVKPVGLDNVVANSNTFNINWQTAVRKQEMDMHLERQYTTVYYNGLEDGVDYLSETKDDAKEINDQKLQWVSFKAHFFSSVLIAKKGISKANLAVSTDTADHVDIKDMKATLAVERDADGSFPMQFYFGPNKYDLLQKQGFDLEKQVNLGWGPLKYINRFAVLPVFHFLEQFNWSYGLIILALTVILKLVLSPLTYKSYLSMAKMRVLKPEMDEIKAKVGEDNPTLLQQEYLKLYKKAGVNPLGGCLPLLLQMPIVIAFFRFFPSLFELRGESFLWMHDLSTYDAFIKFGFTIPFIGDHLSLMCVLMTISTLIYTYFNNQISGVTGQMKYIGYITPIIFLGALNSYPAGLNYYYFLANMFTFLQQYIIRLMVDDKKIHAQIQENKKKPESTKKKTGFAAKMEEMMRAQQQAQAKKK
ncbi:membrane protein insertase YidC [Mucilaginibacter auburnensis]|uniref:Membrane protein insertase YidC n=1 Tax=Mucilaginibacter auburnensis TaxID=1457233 RepID=A0A2H9VL60_9SPHI|nr:membrane protein insertase YidC [Mucilaginibacter auburnensis]PJJ79081.1 YidC/Oxa1 family membrane protein insertase [Mucilaginibacter auburnensis]